MIFKRCIAFAIVCVVAVAGCLPAAADEGARAVGRGKHVSRILDHALVFFRHGNGSQKLGSGLRRGASKNWSGVTRDSLAPNTVEASTLSVRSVYSLPCHWASLHLKI